jgi:hypothetical protein
MSGDACGGLKPEKLNASLCFPLPLKADVQRTGWEVNGTVQSWSLNRYLPPDLDDLIIGQAEEVADMHGIALHDGEEPLLPGRQA